MSTLAATNLKHASSASNNIVLDSSGNATFAGTAVPASSFLRNRIINGAMDIAQRGTSGTTGYLVDRWTALNTSAQSQSSDAPTGFLNSLEFTSSSATFPFVSQRIERINSYDLASRTVTFSLWAKNVSGASTLYVEIYRANTNDNFSAVTLEGTVVLSASPSASWTLYSGSIALSASATTGIELRIIRNNAAAASTRITGVQLEVGTAATPFERRQYGQELALCQRYYEIFGYTMKAGANYYIPYSYKATKRTSPTLALVAGTLSSGTIAGTAYNPEQAMRQVNASTVDADAQISASAEL